MRYFLFVFICFFHGLTQARCQDSFVPFHEAKSNEAFLQVIEATKKGDVKQLTKLVPTIDSSDLKNIKDSRGDNLINIAIKNDQLDTVEFLLTYIDVSQSGFFDSPAHLAASRGNIEALDMIAEQNIDTLSAVDSNQNTLLHKAAKNNRVQMVKRLLNYGLDHSAKNFFGKTPLDVAREFGHPEVVRILKEEQVKALLLFKSKNIELNFYSYKLNQLDISQLNVQNKNGDTILHQIARIRNTRSKKLFQLAYYAISQKADLEIQNNKGLTPIHEAIQSNNFFMLPAMIDSLKELNVRDKQGNTLFHLLMQKISEFKNNKSAINYIAEVVFMLIDKETNINKANNEGDTLLHALASVPVQSFNKPLVRIAERFLDFNIDISSANKKGQTARDIALINNNMAFVQMLANRRAP